MHQISANGFELDDKRSASKMFSTPDLSTDCSVLKALDETLFEVAVTLESGAFHRERLILLYTV